MIDATLPLGGAVLLPVLAAAVAACLPRRARPWLGVLASLATLVVVVLAAVSNLTGSVQTELGGWTPPLGIGLRLTGPGALLILMTALVGAAISLYAAALPSGTGGPAFWPLWLGCWAGLNAVYVSDDLFNIYVALEVVTLAAIALVALGGPPAWPAAFRYLMIAVVGAMLFLLAVGLIFAQTGTLELHAATDSLGGTTAALAVSLAATGLALKVALMPLHGWLIPAHSAAPAAVSPLLSALVVKASLYVLWELVLLLPQAGALLAWVLGALGVLALLGGPIMALRQSRLKPVVAYSTVAQAGYWFVALPVIVTDDASAATPGTAAAAALAGTLVLVLSHGVAKAALFMSAGILKEAYGTDELDALGGAGASMPMIIMAMGTAAVSLAGLPITLGFSGKWQLATAAVIGSHWWLIAVLLLGTLLSAAYLVRTLRPMLLIPDDEPPVRPARVPLYVQAIPMTLGLLAVALGFATVPILGIVARGGL